MGNYFANNIKYLRKTNNLGQEQFGKMFGKSANAISMWENGDREPKIVDALKICERFNVGINDILKKDLSLANNPLTLQADEEQLILAYRQLTDAQKQVIKNMIEAF